MIKLSLTVATIFFVAIALTAQNDIVQDPEARKILDRVSEKTNSHSTIIADFELIIDNRMENIQSSSKGLIKIKGNKYYLESMGSLVYYNGKTMWSFMTDINEVTISEPEGEENNFVDNPALIFNFYNRDFKYRLIGETEQNNIPMYEIDLYPKDLNQPYSSFKLLVKKSNNELYMVRARSKDAIDFTIYIHNLKYNTPLEDVIFEFNTSDYPDIEIIDMRF